MFYRLKNNKELLDWSDYKYGQDCLETNLITREEFNKNPQKIIIQNGEIILNPEWKDIELQKFKEAKIEENDFKRDIALNQGVLYKNILFDSDTDQKVNLLAIVSTMGDEETITWFGKNNDALECTKEDLINIGSLITQLHSYCWGKNAEIKEAINEAKTIEEVEWIAINYDNSCLYPSIPLDKSIDEDEIPF